MIENLFLLWEGNCLTIAKVPICASNLHPLKGHFRTDKLWSILVFLPWGEINEKQTRSLQIDNKHTMSRLSSDIYFLGALRGRATLDLTMLSWLANISRSSQKAIEDYWSTAASLCRGALSLFYTKCGAVGWFQQSQNYPKIWSKIRTKLDQINEAKSRNFGNKLDNKMGHCNLISKHDFANLWLTLVGSQSSVLAPGCALLNS